MLRQFLRLRIVFEIDQSPVNISNGRLVAVKRVDEHLRHQVLVHLGVLVGYKVERHPKGFEACAFVRGERIFQPLRRIVQKCLRVLMKRLIILLDGRDAFNPAEFLQGVGKFHGFIHAAGELLNQPLLAEK